jgi:hypothetical protein
MPFWRSGLDFGGCHCSALPLQIGMDKQSKGCPHEERIAERVSSFAA